MGGDLTGVPDFVERYRLNAKKCLRLARTFHSLKAKCELLLMANAWLVLAAQREKNIETMPGNEPLPPPLNQPPPPNEPPAPPSIDEPPKPPLIEPPPAKEPPPMRLVAANPDDPIQS